MSGSIEAVPLAAACDRSDGARRRARLAKAATALALAHRSGREAKNFFDPISRATL